MTDKQKKDRREEHLAYEFRPYGVDDGCFTYFTPTAGASKISLFTAEITKVVCYRDGDSEMKFYQLEGTASDGENFPAITVSAQEFSGMNWVSQWGPKAVIAAGDKRDHVRTAIQRFSIFFETEIVRTHTGWVDVDGQKGYVTRAGLITAQGLDKTMRVDLGEGPNQFYDIQNHCVEKSVQREAIKTLACVADLRIVGPLTALLPRVLLNPFAGRAPFSTHTYGDTGTGKTSVLGVFMSFFGRNFNPDHFSSWNSTANSLGYVFYQAKDALCPIDDLVPKGTSNDIARQSRETDRVFREGANGNGRQRMTADGRLRRTYHPRGLIVSTGEVPVNTGSVGARLLGVEFREGDVRFTALSEAQTFA